MKKKIPDLIGVIHLPALAGAPGAAGLHPADALREAGMRAVDEARALAKAGFGGVILENFGDAPFYGAHVPAETVASLAVIAAAVRESVSIPVGINVLRNDAKAALAIAAVTGCDFIRVNVLAGVSATDQGLIEGTAAELLRERERLGADVAILADAGVKHARSLSSDDLAVEIEDLALRSGADGVIITGKTTGRFADRETLEAALTAKRLHRISVWIGSGATSENIAEIRREGFGVIVGSDLRKGGRAGAPLDATRVRRFMLAGRKTPKKISSPKGVKKRKK
jgi:membrane complex biogenesis BtpA family protein